METTALKNTNPFDICPVYETESLLLRLVDKPDAEQLFLCYSDPITLSHMNNDNCSGSFRCTSVKIMTEAIQGWRQDFRDRNLIRWSILDKHTGRAIGTAELAPVPYVRKFFGPEPTIGILRIDLRSSHEKANIFAEITYLACTAMAADLAVTGLIAKAPPALPALVSALLSVGFQPDTDGKIPFAHYYSKTLTA